MPPTAVVTKSDNLPRCVWPNTDRYIEYHDTEWGVPLYDDQQLFEFLILEGAQAGLSWITILNRREGYRKAFRNFDVDQVAKITPAVEAKLLLDPGIIRNRLKIKATVTNAKAVLRLRDAGTSLSDYFWSFVDGKPIQNARGPKSPVPASTPLSDKISKDMKQRGFTFVGTTIIYAHMQATGMVNDHLLTCFRHKQCAALAK